jgi:hypothetical protein
VKEVKKMATKIGGTKSASRSVRTGAEVWSRAKRRAESEGVTLNHVINEILEGYGRGLINLPKITKQYQAPKTP